MKNRTTDKIWFPFWADKWIFGSMRLEFDLEDRAIWVDFLALASKDNGYIRANEETPYPITQLSGMLRIPEDKLKKAIEGFIKKKKLRRYKIGTLKITKWEKYQFSDRWKREKEKEIKNPEIEQYRKEFDPLKRAYPEKHSPQDALKAFVALRRRGVSLKTIRQAYNGYMDYLKKKWKQENFEQRPMYLGTFLRENRWKDYIDEKYTPKL